LSKYSRFLIVSNLIIWNTIVNAEESDIAYAAIDLYVLSTSGRSVIDHLKIPSAHALYCTLGVSRVDPDLTSTFHVVALRNTYRHIHNEYVHRINGMQRSRDTNLEVYFFPCSTALALHRKCTDFIRHASASSSEGTQVRFYDRSVIYFVHS
jgi:hypothetical protein